MRTLAPLAAVALAACENTPDYALIFDGNQVPLADLVRAGAVDPTLADASVVGEDPLLDVRTAKPRATVRRGAGGRHLATFQPYLPTEPNGPEAAVQSTNLFTVASASGAPYARRHGPRESIVSVAPRGDGLVALVCDDATGPLLYGFGASSAVFVAAYADLRGLGVCDGPSAVGVATAGVLVAARGEVSRIEDPTGAVTALGPSHLPVEELVWLEERAGGLEAVTWDGAAFAWSDGATAATATVEGEPLGEPVWRGTDDALRLATTAGVWSWSPPADPVRVGEVPVPRVDAAWEVVGAVLLARETRPNDRAPALAVPVATEVALATDAGFERVAVPITPCDDDDGCRNYGESEVVAVAGTAADLVVLYDVWTWAATETHATWAAR